jgi:hypothetical protein
MRTTSSAVALALVACAVPSPVPSPGRVLAADPSIPVDEAVAIWTAHRGVAPYVEDGPVRVLVTAERDLGSLVLGQQLLGLAHPDQHICWIELSPWLEGDLRVQVLAHELGHCLGYRHDRDDRGSLMHPYPVPGQVLREHHR